jgi:transposase
LPYPELTDPEFNLSVLSEFRSRPLAGQAEERLLEKPLVRCESLKLIKSTGQQRTDATDVLPSVRTMNRLELLAETLRAALNELAVAAPQCVRAVTTTDWYDRYGRRIEDTRLPHKTEERALYAKAVGRDGFALLDRPRTPNTPRSLTFRRLLQYVGSVGLNRPLRALGASDGLGSRRLRLSMSP